MTMLRKDAEEMIARNVRGLAALKRIAAANPQLDLKKAIKAREETIAEQEAPENFGTLFYYPGAKFDCPLDTFVHNRNVFRSQTNALQARVAQDFEDKLDKILRKHFNIRRLD